MFLKNILAGWQGRAGYWFWGEKIKGVLSCAFFSRSRSLSLSLALCYLSVIFLVCVGPALMPGSKNCFGTLWIHVILFWKRKSKVS